MGVNRNGTATKYMIYHNGKKLKKGYHNGTKEIWSAGSTVTYYYDESGIGITEEKDYGASCLAPSSFTPALGSWTFIGWKEDTAADANVLTSKTMESDPIVLYAVYTKDVEVKFISGNNGSNVQTLTGTRYYNISGTKVNVTLTVPDGVSYSGWTWRGWSGNGKQDANGEVAYATASIMSDIGGDRTYYGLYQKDITVTYYDNSTAAKTSKQTRYYNAAGNYTTLTFKLAQASVSGWSARGWSTGTAGNSGVTYNNNTDFTRDSNITLYGTYQKTVTLSYNGNGSTGGSTASDSGTAYRNYAGTVIGATFTLKSNGFSRTAFDFVKWDKGTAGTSITLADNATATAVWKQTTLLSGMTAYGSYTTGSSGVWTHPDSAGGFTSKILTDNYVLCHTGNRTWFNEWDSNYKENYIQWTIDVTNLSSITFKGTYYDDYGCEFHSGTLCVNINSTDTVLASVSGGGSGTNTETVNNTVNVSSLSGNITIKLYLYSYDEQGAYTCGLQASGASITAA